MGIITDDLRNEIKQFYYVEGMSTYEIAKKLNIPEHTVDKVLGRLQFTQQLNIEERIYYIQVLS